MIKSFKHPFEKRDVWNDGPEFEDSMGREGAPAVARQHLVFGGGKSGTSTQTQSQTAAPPQWIQNDLQNLYGQAQGVAANPFQQYGGQFVAPVNSQQNTAIGGINQAAGTYAPYGSAATSVLGPSYGQAANTLQQGLSAGQYGTAAAAQPVSGANISQYMSPYIGDVVQATENQQQQQNQIQQSQLEGSAIQSGAFGGDRSGVAAANLAYQQNLANQPVIANLYNTGYNTALGAAQQQQQTGLSAANQIYNQGLSASQQQQALGTGLSQNLSQLGTTAQTNQLNVANAQLGAGTLQQQTQQAQDTALYNQFLQQQAYPFQTTQFLANILEGVAPAAGSTTTGTGTATSPMSFFQRGGRVGLATGGLSANDNDLASLLAAHAQMYGASPGAGSGPYGASLSGSSGGHGQAIQPHAMQMQLPQKGSGLSGDIQGLNQTITLGENLGKLYGAGKAAVVGTPPGKGPNAQPATGGLGGYGGVWGASNPNDPSNVIPFPNPMNVQTLPDGTPITDDVFHRGGRVGLAYGGMPYANQISDPIVPDDIAEPNQATGIKPPSPMALSGGKEMSSGLGSGISDINQLAQMGSTIASIAGMFKRGGRIHRDTGGGLSDAPPASADDTFDRMLVAESGNQHFDDKGNVIVSPKGAVGVAQVMPSTGPEAAKLAGVDWDAGRLQSDPDYNKKLGKAYYNEQQRQFGDPTVAAAAYNAGPEAVRTALARAQKEGGSYTDYLPTETQNYVRKVGGGNAAATGAGMSASAPQGQNVAQSPQSWWDKQSGGLSGTERAVISGLTGLAGMASSPSRFLGSAIAQGLGAGAATYGGLAQKGMGLDIAQQQANTAQTAKGLEVAKFRQSQYEPRLDPKTGQTVYFDKLSGQTLTPAQYRQAMGGVYNMLPGTTGPILSNSTMPQSRPAPAGIPAPRPFLPTQIAPQTADSGSAPASAPVQKPTPRLPDGTPITDEPPPTSLKLPPPAQSTAPTPAQIPSAAPVNKEVDPDYLFGEANRLNDLAQRADMQGAKDQAAGFRAQAEQFTKRATDAAAVNEKAKILPQAQGEALKANYTAQQKARDEAAAEAKLGVQAKAQAQAMMDLYFDPKTGKPTINGGPAGETLTHWGSLLKQAGFSDGLVNSFTGIDANNAQALEKLRTSMGAEIAKQDLGGVVRQQEFNRYMATTPSVEMLPKAFSWIVKNIIIPKADAQMGAYESVADADPLKENIQKKLYEYNKQNPFYKPAPQGTQTAPPTSTASTPTPIPAPKDRKVGRSYTNQNGVSAIWTGNGWKQ